MILTTLSRKLLIKKTLPILAVLSIGSCRGTAGLTICVSDPESQGFWCSKDGAPRSLLLYKDSENYIAMPENDARTLLEECTNGR